MSDTPPERPDTATTLAEVQNSLRQLALALTLAVRGRPNQVDDISRLASRFVAIAGHPLLNGERRSRAQLAEDYNLTKFDVAIAIPMALDGPAFVATTNIPATHPDPVGAFRTMSHTLQQWARPENPDRTPETTNIVDQGIGPFIASLGNGRYSLEMRFAVLQTYLDQTQAHLVELSRNDVATQVSTSVRTRVHGRPQRPIIDPLTFLDLLMIEQTHARSRSIPFDLDEATRRSEVAVAAISYARRSAREKRPTAPDREPTRKKLQRHADRLDATASRLLAAADTSPLPEFTTDLSRRTRRLAAVALGLVGNTAAHRPTGNDITEAIRSVVAIASKPKTVGGDDLVTALRRAARVARQSPTTADGTAGPRPSRLLAPWMGSIAAAIDDACRPLHASPKAPMPADHRERATRSATDFQTVTAAMGEIAQHLEMFAMQHDAAITGVAWTSARLAAEPTIVTDAASSLAS